MTTLAASANAWAGRVAGKKAVEAAAATTTRTNGAALQHVQLYSSSSSSSSSSAPPPPPPVAHAKLQDSFLSGGSAAALDAMERRYNAGEQVPESWAAFLGALNQGANAGELSAGYASYKAGNNALPFAARAAMDTAGSQDTLKVAALVRAYQVAGHAVADLDPLGIREADLDGTVPKELELGYHGLSEADLARDFPVGARPGFSGFLGAGSKTHVRLDHLLERLKEVYTRTIGFEYMHMQSVSQVNWIRARVELPEPYTWSREDKLAILDRLEWSDQFERFCAAKFSSAKRFGLEGAEALIPGMKELIDTACDMGVEYCVLGMPHRGRLNVLANVVRKPAERIFAEFQGAGRDDEVEGSGDVKYHLGMSHDRLTRSGKRVHLSLLANPSHLETVAPVVAGKSRASQFQFMRERGLSMEDAKRAALPIIMHGDAAYAGQGVCYETQGFADLPEYSTGGTIHIVVNNQVGFTTDPRFSRSTPYCTDLAKAGSAPIFHVNADDVEAVCRVFRLAAEFRQTFQRDAVVDLVCYRKHGHNEIDNPSFTQPLTYKKIAKQIPAVQKYRQQLVGEGSITEEEVAAVGKGVADQLISAFEKASTTKTKASDWLHSNWEGYKSARTLAEIRPTGANEEALQKVATKLTQLPEGFTLHSGLKRIIKAKQESLDTRSGIDWGTAEALAFGTLLLEGIHVRLSGQDVERGTFSHRHAVVHDQENENRHTFLNHLGEQAPFTVSNSSLSEYGVLGFELGYSMHSPKQLVIWEAQFGDFVNTAQVIIDQCISAGEAKWMRQTGLTVLLPHGYDGQGPEHSSARMERFLQMSDEDPDEWPECFTDDDPDTVAENSQVQAANWQVCNVSTPANYFHMLRRQVHREFRKPLIVFSPKRLLRHPKCRSTMEEMATGSEFQRVIPDSTPELKDVKKIVMCSGNVYYDLLDERETQGKWDTALVRVEQLSPFPFDLVEEELKRYPDAEVVWAQEEPKNMGPWTFVQPRLVTTMRGPDGSGDVRNVKYAGRPVSASPATGSGAMHQAELRSLLDTAFA